jgi:serine/threonine protein kinase/Tol biopolymer transport system component
MAIAAGARLGPYEILSPLGAGGMGEVYRARDTRLDRDVAVKVLPDAVASDRERLSRFEREAKAVAALSHPNILAIFEFGRSDGIAYAATELLEGETLRKLLASGAPPLRKALEYAVQIANGLAAAHEKGIVHRDVKPDNIFVTTDGRVKILDFGLARLEDSSGSSVNADTVTRNTDPGVVMGTAGYMSPEQVKGLPADHRSDIFSFGAVLYELVSGNRAFRKETTAETMTAILKQAPPDLERIAPAVPPGLVRIVDHCLEKSAAERFQSARDVAFDLQALSAERAVATSLPALRPGFGRRRVALAALGVPLLALSHFAVYRTADETPDSVPAFTRLTFRRGFLGNARFSPDGQTVIYSALWDGGGPEILSMRLGSPQTRTLGLPPSNVAAISSSGELAIILGTGRTGTLARVSLMGGSPREITDAVEAADWAPDGKDLAIVRRTPQQVTVEFPIGKILASGPLGAPWFSAVRVSPTGSQVAYLEHLSGVENSGWVVVSDLAGRTRRLTDRWESVLGMCWAPGGRELWFTAAKTGNARWLHAVDLEGRVRVLHSGPGAARLLDVQEGRVLLESLDRRSGIAGWTPGQAVDRDLSWLDYGQLFALSRDGQRLLFSEQGQGSSAGNDLYLRRMDGTEPVLIGKGWGSAFSPDGRTVLATPVTGGGFVLVPTGAGQSRELKFPALEHIGTTGGTWLADGERIVFRGADKTGVWRVYVANTDGTGLRGLSGPGVQSFTTTPDGSRIAVRISGESRLSLGSLAGDNWRPGPELQDADSLTTWSADGRWLYVSRSLPNRRARVDRVDVARERREPWREVGPQQDPNLVSVSPVRVAPETGAYAYRYVKVQSDLYLVEGIR